MKCNRDDDACSGEKATEVVVWIPTGETFEVCPNCADAITNRSKRVGQNWKRG